MLISLSRTPCRYCLRTPPGGDGARSWGWSGPLSGTAGGSIGASSAPCSAQFLARPLPTHAPSDGGDFLQVNDFARRTGWLHPAAVAYANYGIILFAVLLVVGWFLARRQAEPRRMAHALLAPVAILVAVGVNQPIVHWVNEPRPYARLPQTLLLVHRSVDASLPSDHATMAGAVAAGLLYVSWRLGLAAVAAALLMAATRVYVGAHYPVDVLAGVAVGAAVAALTQLATRPVEWLVYRAECTSLRPLLTERPRRALAASPAYRSRAPTRCLTDLPRRSQASASS